MALTQIDQVSNIAQEVGEPWIRDQERPDALAELIARVLPKLQNLQNVPTTRLLPGDTFPQPFLRYFSGLKGHQIKGLVCQLVDNKDADAACQQGSLLMRIAGNTAEHLIENAIALFALALRLIDHTNTTERFCDPAWGHGVSLARKHIYLDGMATATEQRYNLSNNTVDYEEAVHWRKIGLIVAREDFNQQELSGEALANRLWCYAALLMDLNNRPFVVHEPFEPAPEHAVSDEAFDMLKEAYTLATSPHMKGHIATHTSLALYGRYLREPTETTVLDEALKMGMQEMQTAEKDGFVCLSDLSWTICLRWSDMLFERARMLGDMADFDASLKYCEIAYEKTGKSTCYLLRLCNIKVAIVGAMLRPFNVRRAPSEHQPESRQYKLLNEVIEQTRDALRNCTTASARTRAGWLTMLGIAYLFAGGESNVRRAITHLDEAVASEGCRCPGRGVTKVAWLRRAETYMHLAFHTGQYEDYSTAFKSLREAAAQRCASHDGIQADVDRVIQHNLADLSLQLYSSDPKQYAEYGSRSLDVMLSCLERFDHIPVTSHVWLLGNAAKLCVKLQRDHNQAVKLISDAITLLPKATQPHAGRLEQLRMIRKFYWIPHTALNIFLFAGLPIGQAIVLYESCRGIIWERLMDIQVVEKLRIESLLRLTTRLSGTHLAIPPVASSTKNVQEKPYVMTTDIARLEKYERVAGAVEELSKSRTNPELIEYLGISPIDDEIQKYSCDGPVVIVNSSFHSADAIVISRHRINKVELPLLDKRRAWSLLEKLGHVTGARMMHENFGAASAEFERIMTWFWQVLAKPLLDSIDFTEYVTAGVEKPRIFWIANGLLSLLPIHTVGDWRPGPTVKQAWRDGELADAWCERSTKEDEASSGLDSVHARVISSYIPTLKALRHIRQCDSAQRVVARSDDQSILLVGMPTTPGERDLNALGEIETIIESTESSMSYIEQRNPTHAQTMASLSHCSIAHFACHGRAHPLDPSLSCVMLEDWQTKPLTFRDLLKVKLHRCRLAFVSACESMLIKDWRLLDEGVHFGGGLLMAGVPNVISTMWSVDDAVANSLALLFYEFLKDEQGIIDCSKSATALHNALDGLIFSGLPPILWGAYTHSGG